MATPTESDVPAAAKPTVADYLAAQLHADAAKAAAEVRANCKPMGAAATADLRTWLDKVDGPTPGRAGE